MSDYINEYTDALVAQIKESMTDALTLDNANDAFAFHFNDKRSYRFQEYYRNTINNRQHFFGSTDFFRTFKSQYSLQGIDGSYLDHLETRKQYILDLIDNGKLYQVYCEFFKSAEMNRGKRELGSFFTKLAHTFQPEKFCAVDKYIRDYFCLGKESFYISFLVLNRAYQEWSNENPVVMEQIRQSIWKNNNFSKMFPWGVSDIKLMDMIFLYMARQ